jgi:two-component system response regulator
MSKKDEIILIEDNPMDSELAIKAFRKAGVIGVIRVLNDGAEALDYFFGMGKHQGRNSLFIPKLVLLDLKIPKVNGLEVLDLIRSNRFTRTIPVIIFSSSAVSSDIVEAYKKGANSYLIKPINFKEYCHTLKLLADYWLSFNKTPYS